MNGRNLTLEQYFEYKDEFNKNKKEKEQLMRDRQTHVLYGESDDESFDAAEWESNSQSCSESEKMEYTT